MSTYQSDGFLVCEKHGNQPMDANGECAECSLERKTEITQLTPSEQSRIGSTIITAQTARPSEFGAALVRNATERGNKAFMDSVQNRVQEIVSHLNNLFLAKDKLEKEIALFQKRLEAIKAGEFKIENNVEFGARILYNDILLNF